MDHLNKLRAFIDSELADELVAAGILRKAAADRALRAAQSSGAALERTMLELGLASESAIYQRIAKWLDVPFVQPDEFDTSLILSVPLDLAFLERVEAVPVAENSDGSITIATSNPRAGDSLSSISFQIGQSVRPAVCTRSAIRKVIAKVKSQTTATEDGDTATDAERLRFLSNEGPIVALVNDLLAQAVTERASDVHIEMLDSTGRVRFRVDGVLHVERRISTEDVAMIASRLKVMAGLNISEKRRPQDGRAKIAVMGRNIDLRLSTLPSHYGESVVVRILDREVVALDWSALGYSVEMRGKLRKILSQSSGIFLVAGPTGSGKTTTLYTALSELSTEARKIITVEDPIEYALDGVMQVQVRPEIDMTFARTLRAILRQDPDVILIGEIRDQETAEIAVRAALVGRLVLSTVHTNDSLTAIDRLRDLGVPGYLLAATLRGVLSQRLVRRTCRYCAGRGCDDCSSSGLKGRTVVTELMPIPPDAAKELADIDSSAELPADSALRSYSTLAECAQELVASGLTTADEVRHLDLND